MFLSSTKETAFQLGLNNYCKYETLKGQQFTTCCGSDNPGVRWVTPRTNSTESFSRTTMGTAHGASWWTTFSHTEIPCWDSQSFSDPAEPTSTISSQILHFVSHIIIVPKHLSEQHLNDLRTLFITQKGTLSKNWRDQDLKNDIKNQIKLKPDAEPFLRAFGSITSLKKQAMNKTV